MLEYNELRPGMYIIFNGDPYEIVGYQFLRMQQRKPVAQVKMKNLINKNCIAHTFHQGEKIEEAEIEYKKAKYIFSKKDEFWFVNPENLKDRIMVKEDIIGDKKIFLKENEIVNLVLFKDKVIGIKLPIKMDFKVIEAPPSIRGNTAQGGTKQVKIETGAMINAPLFINGGDIIRVNTETKEYVERVKKGE